MLLGSAGVGVGGIVVGVIGIAKDVLTRRWQVQDKERERLALREDTHRAELRAAYGEFIAAYKRFLDLGAIAVIEAKELHRLEESAGWHVAELTSQSEDIEDAQESAVNESGGAFRKARADCVEAAMACNQRAGSLLLIEGDRDQQSRILEIIEDDPEILTSHRDDHAEPFGVAMQEGEKRLGLLLRGLAGRFAHRSQSNPSG